MFTIHFAYANVLKGLWSKTESAVWLQVLIVWTTLYTYKHTDILNQYNTIIVHTFLCSLLSVYLSLSLLQLPPLTLKFASTKSKMYFKVRAFNSCAIDFQAWLEALDFLEKGKSRDYVTIDKIEISRFYKSIISMFLYDLLPGKLAKFFQTNKLKQPKVFT